MSAAISSQIRFRRVPATSNRARTRAQSIDWFAITLLIVHLPLGLLVSRSPLLSTAHSLLTVTVGLLLAAKGRNRPERVAYAAAYIVGAEVLWRMTGAQIFWEFGKYASSGIFLLFLVLHRRRRLPGSPILYFALLLPSAGLTVMAATNFREVQQPLSFYLSGPLALAIAWCFFAQLRLSPKQMQRIFLSLLCPCLSIATVAMSSTLSIAKLDFTDNSNLATSGGFGPNQVSGVLGFGIVVGLLWLLSNKGNWINQTVIFAALAFVATQAALTFSRGGLYNAAGASMMAIFYLLRDRRSRVRVIVSFAVLLLTATFVIVPRLEAFTGGAISTRFKNVDPTKRQELAESNLLLWRDHPVLGVGPGMVAAQGRMPHTEFTRLLAEHGVLGLFAIGVLGFSAVQAIRRARSNAGKAVAGSMVVFSVLFMLDKAMRLAAPAFAFGLSFSTLVRDEESQTLLERKLRLVDARRRKKETPSRLAAARTAASRKRVSEISKGSNPFDNAVI